MCGLMDVQCSTQMATALSRILGAFSVSVRSPTTSYSYDFVAIENAFFGLVVDKIYDLKGLVGGRLCPLGSIVQMDGNVVQELHRNPLLVRPDYKRKLMSALRSDTTALAGADIVDYSLLVGVCGSSGCLVVSIIGERPPPSALPSVRGALLTHASRAADYLRRYTWDKQVETVVKSAAKMSTGEWPTIVPPQAYRVRFLEGVARYVYAVPE
eukprot:m51a1_g11824 putative 1-phosphatidylinositol-3-phosphate 5-kinase fab1 (212) ;mRNA; r:414106-414741